MKTSIREWVHLIAIILLVLAGMLNTWRAVESSDGGLDHYAVAACCFLVALLRFVFPFLEKKKWSS